MESPYCSCRLTRVRPRHSQCWRDFDTKYFKIPRAERAAAIAADKDLIIARINSDYQKLYFGCKSDGTVCDLDQMSYAEVLRRMVRAPLPRHNHGLSSTTRRPEPPRVVMQRAPCAPNGPNHPGLCVRFRSRSCTSSGRPA